VGPGTMSPFYQKVHIPICIAERPNRASTGAPAKPSSFLLLRLGLRSIIIGRVMSPSDSVGLAARWSQARWPNSKIEFPFKVKPKLAVALPREVALPTLL
jgi:hypothetical protein